MRVPFSTNGNARLLSGQAARTNAYLRELDCDAELDTKWKRKEAEATALTQQLATVQAER